MMGVGQLLSEDGVSFGGDDNVLGIDGAMVYIMLRILSNTTELFTLWVFFFVLVLSSNPGSHEYETSPALLSHTLSPSDSL